MFFMLHHHIDVGGAGRGAVAMEDLRVGDIALEIPVSIILSEDLVHKSDMVLFHNLKTFNDFMMSPALGYTDCYGSKKNVPEDSKEKVVIILPFKRTLSDWCYTETTNCLSLELQLLCFYPQYENLFGYENRN